jgi:hypothetical protein
LSDDNVQASKKSEKLSKYAEFYVFPFCWGFVVVLDIAERLFVRLFVCFGSTTPQWARASSFTRFYVVRFSCTFVTVLDIAKRFVCSFACLFVLARQPPSWPWPPHSRGF